MWTGARIEVDSRRTGSAPDTITVAYRGGVVPDTDVWAIATHVPQLGAGERVEVGLAEVDASLSADLAAQFGVAASTIRMPFGGNRGVAHLDGTAFGDRHEISAAFAPTGLTWQAMPIPYKVNPNVDTDLLPNATALIHRSMQTWTDDPGSAISFRYDGASTTTEREWPLTNTIYAGPAPGILGQAVFGGNQGPGIVNQFDVIINSGPLLGDLPWHDGAAPLTFDLGSVIMHEIGHVIGLDHSSDQTAIMFPSLTAGTSIVELAADDAAGVASLYPASVPTGAQYTCDTPPAEAIVGTAGDDNLIGSTGDDWIIGLGGNDTLSGGGGNDTLCGGYGDDVLIGADGDDRLYGNDGNDTLWGQAGNDTLHGHAGVDKLRGGDDNDQLSGGSGDDDLNGGRDDDTANGEDGNDLVRGGTGDDSLNGGNGDDKVSGNGGSDVVNGGPGNDEVLGGPRPDVLSGGDGDDLLKGLGGADSMYGDEGNDDLFGGKQPDPILHGGPGTDMCNGGSETEVASAPVDCESLVNLP